ncbi:MAG: heme ABC exporter ATP-binding protein CcmA [Candidatus Zhuqueibacterota bacterium]
MIVIQNLIKSFGSIYALRGINLTLNAGEFWMIVGPNGAGKTTLLKIIATLSRATDGSITIDGADPHRSRLNVRKQIGFIGHQSFLYDKLTAEENLRFYSRMYLVKQNDREIDDLLAQVGLIERKTDLVRNFSRGMHQRLAIARALLNDPRIILLDEPFTGLDQRGIDIFTHLLQSLVSPDRLLMMTTHDLHVGWSLADHYAIISRGKVLDQQACRETTFENFQANYRNMTEGSIS